jgi:hypothetical protein
MARVKSAACDEAFNRASQAFRSFAPRRPTFFQALSIA